MVRASRIGRQSIDTRIHFEVTTKAVAMTAAVALSACLLGSWRARAQGTAAPVKAEIHSPGTVKMELVLSLVVMTAQGASIQGHTLTLNGTTQNVITFADRPVRAAGHLLTTDFLEEWTAPDGTFRKDPPNATVSVLDKDGNSASDAVVELTHPHLAGDKLTFDVRVQEGSLTGADGPASVFVDMIGLPFTPLSVAGVARRTARRTVWIGAATAPHYYYPPPPPPPYYYYPPHYYYPPPP